MTREQIKEAADKSWGFDKPPVTRELECPRCGTITTQKGYGTNCHCECGCAWWEVDISALRRKEKTMVRLLNELTDDSECRYDHHGYCQEHNLHEKPCPHEEAKKLLGKVK